MLQRKTKHVSFLKFFPVTFWFLRSLDKEYFLEILEAVTRQNHNICTHVSYIPVRPFSHKSDSKHRIRNFLLRMTEPCRVTVSSVITHRENTPSISAPSSRSYLEKYCHVFLVTVTVYCSRLINYQLQLLASISVYLFQTSTNLEQTESRF